MSDEPKGEARNDAGERPQEQASARESEGGDVAEPDAPSAGEENDAMSTILDAGPLLGVQDNADDEGIESL
ncbi:MAG TPA: hypothetical protein VFA21_01665 [Pyrinomonadaceae bacterium]|jgi:hypothetical protein|nr:hypothetical protein [Pyrinomonadaceae bacterium]